MRQATGVVNASLQVDSAAASARLRGFAHSRDTVVVQVLDRSVPVEQLAPGADPP